ncbi:MAG: rod shape-determining protein MreC [Opitutaceae bacterium]|nr:rod shape-determining protein MreC [Opitutaceae bacterium]
MVPVAVKSFMRASFFELQAPISVSASHLRDLQEYWSLRTQSKRELIEAGRDLARVNASYALAAQENTTLHAELDRLKNLLRLPPMPAHRLEYARVVRRDFSAWWQRLVIRKGRDYGIPVGAPVVFSGGVVGRIAEVHAYTSVVELVGSPGVRLAAVIEGDDRPMSFQGGLNPAFGPAKGVIEFVPLDLFAGPTLTKRLVTSGLGGVFPAGLTLGRVIKLEPSTDGLFKTGEVELDPRLGELTEVTVLVPLAPN